MYKLRQVGIETNSLYESLSLYLRKFYLHTSLSFFVHTSLSCFYKPFSVLSLSFIQIPITVLSTYLSQICLQSYLSCMYIPIFVFYTYLSLFYLSALSTPTTVLSPSFVYIPISVFSTQYFQHTSLTVLSTYLSQVFLSVLSTNLSQFCQHRQVCRKH